MIIIIYWLLLTWVTRTSKYQGFQLESNDSQSKCSALVFQVYFMANKKVMVFDPHL